MNTISNQHILNVVRGVDSWSTINGIKLTIEAGKRVWQFESHPESPCRPSLKDIALGFQNMSQQPNQLHQWASWLLASATIVDLSDISSTTLGDELLGDLWEACGNQLVSEETKLRVRRIVEDSHE